MVEAKFFFGGLGLKNFVKLIQQVYEQRYMQVLKKILAKKIPVALLSIDSKAIDTVKNFREQGLNVTLLITEKTSRDDLEFDVVALNDAAKIYPPPEYIFVENLFAPRVALKNFPASKVISLNGSTDEAYEVFMTHLDELREVYESLIDEKSKKTFCGYWLGNISNQLGEIFYSNEAHYLINGFIPERGAVVIDGGVFDGGTAALFAQMGYEVYGFEPSTKNFELARKVAEENNFVAENLGLGSFKHEATFLQDEIPGSSKFDVNGTEIVQVTTLDAYVREKNLQRVDFIKLDVEGAELDILRGAVTTIARFKPILALSAYHKWDDFWTLMNFVKSIRPDYEFALRQSFDSVEDTPSLFTQEYLTALDELGLERDIRSFNECVLFAR